jgi:hypothetical protein
MSRIAQVASAGQALLGGMPRRPAAWSAGLPVAGFVERIARRFGQWRSSEPRSARELRAFARSMENVQPSLAGELQGFAVQLDTLEHAARTAPNGS